MKRKILFTLLSLAVILTTLAGCASIQLPWAKSGTQNSQSSQSSQNPTDLNNQPVENKLAVGILKLEGTDHAVTAEEAKKLLPLWKAVKGLSSDTKTTTEEMTGLYKQIMTAMTPEQVKAIQDMTLAQSDLQELMQKYGVQFRGGGAPGQSGAARTPSASGGSNPQFQGGPGFQGGGPGGGFPPGAGQSRGQNSSRTQTTPQPGAGAARSGFRGGLNFMLADAVIKLLQERAAS